MKNSLFGLGMLVCLCMATTGVQAQTSAYEPARWSLGAHAGATWYFGDIAGAPAPIGGLSVGFSLTPVLSLQLTGQYGQLRDNGKDQYQRSFRNNFAAGDLRVNFSLHKLFQTDRLIPKTIPYVFGGAGLMRSSVTVLTPASQLSNNEAENYRGTDLYYTVGGGFQFFLTNRMDLKTELVYCYSNTEKLDGHDYKGVSNRFNDQFVYLSVGLNIRLGKNKTPLEWSHMERYTPPAPPAKREPRPWYFSDVDRDGVADSLDQDNNTPAGVRVTTKGVAMDTDYDGIADYLDPCPLVPGANGEGCPPKDSERTPVESSEPEGRKYYIIVASMTNKENAKRVLAKYLGLGYNDARIIEKTYPQLGSANNTFYRVAIKTYSTRAAALEELQVLRQKIDEKIWVFYE